MAAALLYFVTRKSAISAPMLRCLRDKGTIAVQWEGRFDYKAWSGVKLVPVTSLPALVKALAGGREQEVSSALARSRTDGILVRLRGGPQLEAQNSIAATLSHYGYAPGLKAVCLDPDAALYVPDPIVELSSSSKIAVATVARALLEGAEPPQVSSFPEPLRRSRITEVMVSLLRGDELRLWRSARGGSIARALITAATIARRRWNERAQTMGGALNELLPTLDVQVTLLREDGTLLGREPSFVDLAISRDHGIGYEHKTSWQFLLPEATVRFGNGSGTRAFQYLFEKEKQPSLNLQNPELRLYRFVVVPLARSTVIN